MLRKLKTNIRLTFRDYILCASSALLLILAFPSSNLWLLAWFGFVPVFFALNNKSKTEAFLLFFITGVIFWAGTIYWLVHVTLAGTIVLILYLALYFAFFGLIIRPCTRHSSPYALIFIPSVWVLLEYLRSHLLTGFPWALLGYSQHRNLLLIQIADITGAWGVSFMIVLVNVAVVEIIWSGSKRIWPRLKITLALVSLFLFCVLSYGYFRLTARPKPSSGERLKISLIQGNIPQELKWDPRSKEYIGNKYLELSLQATKDNPDLLVWPEAALPVILEEEPVFFEAVREFVEAERIPLLLGAVTSREGFYYNSAILLKPGSNLDRYDKLHLVPFGEYIPLRRVLPFLQVVVPIGDVTAGKHYTIFRTPRAVRRAPSPGQNIDFAVLICFEDLFPELSREFVGRGADFLINITNDAWYKKTSAAHQHLEASVFRAIENRVYLVRAANTGVSAFISPRGEIIDTVNDGRGDEIFIDGYRSKEITLLKAPRAFYTRYGDIFIFFCLIFVLYSIIADKKYRQ
jgi:apolipoprotein N-acyltransferase